VNNILSVHISRIKEHIRRQMNAQELTCMVVVEKVLAGFREVGRSLARQAPHVSDLQHGKICSATNIWHVNESVVA
jgi:hypothetical protein